MPLRVTYRFAAPGPSDAAAHAEALLVEQTVETPPAVSQRSAFVRERLGGAVERVVETAEGVFDATLVLPDAVADTDAVQLLNVLFGNASIHPGIALVAAEVPEARRRGYGPRHGLDGWRRLLGTPARPFVASALKPAGLAPDELAALALGFGLGGLDLVKDDHYLADHPFCPFDLRVRAVVHALDRAADATGRRTRYAPNVSGTPPEILRQAETAQRLGADALLVAPMLVGLPALHALTRAVDLPVLAHPSFSGGAQVRPETMLGTLFPLFGADAVIFAGYGGRFAVSRETCRGIAEAARASFPDVGGALPVPAGGMTVERGAELAAFYGPDTMLLVGGSLLTADTPGDPRALADATRALLDAVSP